MVYVEELYLKNNCFYRARSKVKWKLNKLIKTSLFMFFDFRRVGILEDIWQNKWQYRHFLTFGRNGVFRKTCISERNSCTDLNLISNHRKLLRPLLYWNIDQSSKLKKVQFFFCFSSITAVAQVLGNRKSSFLLFV